ncbi:NUDIX hydrolase [Roseobacter sp.]|uniref:NUDIX hydrolase n=1 Tax=Roseobacter sp. TaxID=1907202 RepID=UPI0032975A8E
MYDDPSVDKTAIRDAATVIVVRDRHIEPRILMGQRGANAAFMPNKFVFPGGAVDPTDRQTPLAAPIPEPCKTRLRADTAVDISHALTAAAIRELWEETGLALGIPGPWPGAVPTDWAEFAATGCVPTSAPLRFVFRALTPPGRPRRFDARFFTVDASALAGDLDDFTHASDELSHLQWVTLAQARSFDMPFITEVVLAEIGAHIKTDSPPTSVPFFKNNDEDSLFLRLRGAD